MSARRALPLLATLLAAVLAGSGCVASAVGAGEVPPATFDLVTPAAIDSDVSPARGVQLLVPEPSTLATLASQRIVVRTGPREVQYLGDARYVDTLTKLTQFKLKRALEGSRSIGAVGLPGEGMAIDYQVLTDIRAFEVRTDTSPATAFVSLTIKILDDRSGNVVASRVFDRSAPVGPIADDAVGDAYLAALDAALDSTLLAIRSWVAATV